MFISEQQVIDALIFGTWPEPTEEELADTENQYKEVDDDQETDNLREQESWQND